MEAMLGNPNQTGEPEAPSVKAGRFTFLVNKQYLGQSFQWFGIGQQ